MIKPIELITALRESDFYIECIFMQGSCFKFHLFLKSIYPESEPYMSDKKDHVISRIGSEFYDITGMLSLKNKGERYFAFTESDYELASKWSFSNKCMIQLGECPQCDEPLIFEP